MTSNVAPRSQQGFVLIMVLAALVLLSLLAMRLDMVSMQMREEAQFRVDLQRHQVKTRSALERVIWQMISQPTSMYGFGAVAPYLRVDGRVYRLDHDLLVSVQDTRGLLNLNFFEVFHLQQFLLQTGVSAEELDRFVDVLMDYMDMDDLVRLQGAERPEYIRAELPWPRNDWLMNVNEVRNMPSWRDEPELLTAIQEFTTTHSEGIINVNTAPREVLLGFPGALPEGVDNFIARREEQPFLSLNDFRAETGAQLLDEEAVHFFPGLFYRVRIWSELGFPAVEYIVMLTPNYLDSPFQVLDARYLSRPEIESHVNQIEAFPFLSLEANGG